MQGLSDRGLWSVLDRTPIAYFEISDFASAVTIVTFIDKTSLTNRISYVQEQQMSAPLPLFVAESELDDDNLGESLYSVYSGGFFYGV